MKFIRYDIGEISPLTIHTLRTSNFGMRASVKPIEKNDGIKIVQVVGLNRGGAGSPCLMGLERSLSIMI
ncbi:MAG: hypothetical protein ACRESZ_14235 [Methylococcales bacterium]